MMHVVSLHCFFLVQYSTCHVSTTVERAHALFGHGMTVTDSATHDMPRHYALQLCESKTWTMIWAKPKVFPCARNRFPSTISIAIVIPRIWFWGAGPGRLDFAEV